ncbi:Uncharacterised protein [uncultured archaeon]|nr:Uncharacterised protein [uncultured archaeon]
MRLTKTQLKILELIYSKGSGTSKETAGQLKLTQQYTSKSITDLKEKGFLEKKGTQYSISSNVHAYYLRNLLLEHPRTNFEEILADSRLDVLMLLFTKRTGKRIRDLSGLSKPLIYKHLRGFLKYGVVVKQGRYYKLNNVLWSELVDFLESCSKYQNVLAYTNLPTVSRVLYETKDLKLFEVPANLKIDEKTATFTAFSVFDKYGIPVRLTHNYFCMPPQKLGINDVFAHAALCSDNMRKRLFTILFYLKNKGLLDIKYIEEKYKLRGYINKINAILKGETIREYPTTEEIKQKAELYDIKY